MKHFEKLFFCGGGNLYKDLKIKLSKNWTLQKFTVNAYMVGFLFFKLLPVTKRNSIIFT